jgi:hypothetical protein
LRSTFSSVREWVWLLPRYAWTRPPVYRVAGVLAVVYTIVTAVYVEAALWAWLLGLFVGLVGWGVMLEASRLSVSDLQRYRRANGDDVGVLFDQMLSRLPLSVARRIERLIGAFLTLVGAILIFLSIARAVRSMFAL